MLPQVYVVFNEGVDETSSDGANSADEPTSIERRLLTFDARETCLDDNKSWMLDLLTWAIIAVVKDR